MLTCSKCGKKTRKPRTRNGITYCPKCFEKRLRALIAKIRFV